MTDAEAIARVLALRHRGRGCRIRNDAADPCEECQALERVVALLELEQFRLDKLDMTAEVYGYEEPEGQEWRLAGPYGHVRQAIDELELVSPWRPPRPPAIAADVDDDDLPF